MEFNVADETSSLKSVIIGVAKNSGKIPDLKDLYDPKSVRNLLTCIRVKFNRRLRYAEPW